MKKINTETWAGIFVVLGILSFGYLSVKLLDISLFGSRQ